MAIYMNWDSNSISGAVTAAGFEKEIELQSAQMGVGRGIASPVGAAENREASAPSVSEIVVSKMQDQSSLGLFEQSLIGEDKTVVISFVAGGTGQLVAYCQMTLSNTLVSGYSLSSGGDRPTESISLNFAKIEYKFIDTSVGGDANPKTCTYDLATAKKV